MYEVLIIGAGPAGTAAAFDLVSVGRSVLLVDRRRFPRTKACAGGITPKALNLFAYDISHLIERQCRTVRVRMPGGQSFDVTERFPLCHMVQRRELDLYSLNQVVARGGGFLKVHGIRAVTQAKDHVIVETDEGRYRGRYLIGADGANSGIRRKAVFPHRPYRINRYPALEADVPLNRPDLFPMEFDFSREIPGYYWIFPKGDHVSVGIFSRAGSALVSAGHLREYAWKRLGSRDLRNVKGYPIGAGGVRGPGSRLPGAGRVLLAGDAAGFAEPLLGEGIYFALKSGRTAAAAVIRSLTHGGDALRRYHKALARVYLDLALYRWASLLLYRFPEPCLGLAQFRSVHGSFSRAYAEGRPLSRILFPF